MHIFTVMEQGAGALLINHTQNATPLPPTLRPPPLTVAAQNAKGRGLSTETALTIFVKDVTAGARDTPNPIAPQQRQQRQLNRRSGMRNNDWGKCEGAPWVPVDPKPRWTWTRVSVIPNKEWMKPWEVIDLTSPPSSQPPTPPPPSPLSSLPSLISEFGDSSSGSAPPSFWTRSMSVTLNVERGVMIQTLFLYNTDRHFHLPKT